MAGLTSTATIEDVERVISARLHSSKPIAEQTPFREEVFREISEALSSVGQLAWSRVPRLYATLSITGNLDVIDSLLAQGLTDAWFPLTHKTLPVSIQSPASRADFIQAQNLVLTKGLSLEEDGSPHRHFSDILDIPLKKLCELGRGAYGYVDKVLGTVGGKTYALKAISRGRSFQKDRNALEQFELELARLKKVKHKHIVELIASYTTPQYVGIVMSPAADSNLKEFLGMQPLSVDRRSCLASFFGCLAAAVSCLHQNNISHEDIKPQNVLVKGYQVFVTDFGISRDWTDTGRSTTTGYTPRTPKYCSPEVAADKPRNRSADMWSLGCVYLEMWSVLCGETLSNLTGFLQSHGSKSANYHENIDAINAWCVQLSKTENVDFRPPYCWIAMMLEQEPTKRCKSPVLIEMIQNFTTNHYGRHHFIGLCCSEEEDTAESVQSSEFYYEEIKATNEDTTAPTRASLVIDELAQPKDTGVLLESPEDVAVLNDAETSLSVLSGTPNNHDTKQKSRRRSENCRDDIQETIGKFAESSSPFRHLSPAEDVHPEAVSKGSFANPLAPLCNSYVTPLGSQYVVDREGNTNHPGNLRCNQCQKHLIDVDDMFPVDNTYLCWFDYVVRHARVCRGCGTFIVSDDSADRPLSPSYCNECTKIGNVLGKYLDNNINITATKSKARKAGAKPLKLHLARLQDSARLAREFLEKFMGHTCDVVNKAVDCQPFIVLADLEGLAQAVLTLTQTLLLWLRFASTTLFQTSNNSTQLRATARKLVEHVHRLIGLDWLGHNANKDLSMQIQNNSGLVIKTSIRTLLRYGIVWKQPIEALESDTLDILRDIHQYADYTELRREDLRPAPKYVIEPARLYSCDICETKIEDDAIIDWSILNFIWHPDCLQCNKCGAQYKKDQCSYCGADLPRGYEYLSAFGYLSLILDISVSLKVAENKGVNGAASVGSWTKKHLRRGLVRHPVRG